MPPHQNQTNKQATPTLSFLSFSVLSPFYLFSLQFFPPFLLFYFYFSVYLGDLKDLNLLMLPCSQFPKQLMPPSFDN